MCGIIGIIGKGDVAQRLVDGLKRLEYRGYDSAGLATPYRKMKRAGSFFLKTMMKSYIWWRNVPN